MEIRNEKLYRAMKDYVASAITFVATKARQQPTVNENHFNWYWVLARQGTDFSQVSNYATCLELLTADKFVSKHLNQCVGLTPSAEGMMKSILDLGRSEHGYDFDSNRFDREYSIFEDTFYRDSLICSAIAPVDGLLWKANPLQLAEGLEISQLKQEEMSPHRIDDSLHWNQLWCAARLQYELPKFFRDQSDRFTYNERQTQLEQQVAERLEEVVNSLRLFANWDFNYSGIIFQKPKWSFIRSFTMPSPVRGRSLADLLFEQASTHSFSSLWQKLDSSRISKELGVAARRFGESRLRHREDDKVIDLMIAAESLFLRGTKDGEKSFRLAFRACRFLGSSAVDQQEIYKRFRLAYHLRSVLVHGGKVSSDRQLRRIDIPQLINKVSDDVRTSVLKAIDLLVQDEELISLNDDFWDQQYLFQDSNRVRTPDNVDAQN